MSFNQKTNQLVVKHNDIINTRYSLSPSEMKIILLTISKIKLEDHELKEYTFSIKEFIEETNSSQNMYEKAKLITKSLMQRVFEQETDTGVVQINWLSKAKYRNGCGEVILSFNPYLKPYLLGLKERYTKYFLKNVLPLKSSYTARIYEFLKQYEPIGERTFEVSVLKDKLMLSKQYKKYNDFKRNIILYAQKELKIHTDIFFSFKEKKTGRKVTHITFFIYPNINQKETEKDIFTLTVEQAKELTNLFNKKSLNGFITKENMLKLSKKHKADYKKIKNIITNIEFKPSYNSISTLINALKGSYIISKENQRDLEHERIRKQEQGEMLLREEALRREQEELNVIFNSLTEEQRAQYMGIAKRQLKEESANLDETIQELILSEGRVLSRARTLAKKNILKFNKATI